MSRRRRDIRLLLLAHPRYGRQLTPDYPDKDIRSGKIMRRLLRDTAENREPGDVTTLADPSVMDRVQRATAQSSK